MMTFEDIVDMDWLDSHSVKGEPMDLFPNDYVDYNHYLAADLLSPRLEHASSPPPLLLASPPPPSSSSSMFHPATSAASCSAAAALAAATTTPPPPLTFPTTEQIKQLIELAKHQLALRAAQTNNNTNNSNSNSSNRGTLASSASSTPTDKATLDSTNSAAAISSTVSPTASSPTSQLAAHLANTTLFVNSPDSNNSNTNLNDLPDTVSPESLMKTVISAPASLPPPSKSKKQHSLTSGSSSPTSNPATVKLEEDSSMTPFSLSHAMDEEDDEIHTKKYTSTSRRSSLLADEVKSLEAYAESDGIDIKKLTPRERRQLRNKISARNFRVRRKEYITTLEQQVSDHKKHAESLADQLGKVEHENCQLREQVDSLKRQNLLLQQV